MKQISDIRLLNQYCEQNRIPSHFDNWNLLTKILVSYKKGERIALYGENVTKLFFLVSGTIKFSCISDNYEEFFFFNASNGGLFGEVEYALGIASITESEVIQDAVCVEIPLAGNRVCLDNDLAFQKYVRNVLAQKYNEVRSHYMDIETIPLDVRVARLIIDQEESSQITNLAHIAQSTGGSYRQINRIFASFCRKGLLEHLPEKGRYRILDRDALRLLAEQLNTAT